MSHEPGNTYQDVRESLDEVDTVWDEGLTEWDSGNTIWDVDYNGYWAPVRIH